MLGDRERGETLLWRAARDTRARKHARRALNLCLASAMETVQRGARTCPKAVEGLSAQEKHCGRVITYRLCAGSPLRRTCPRHYARPTSGIGATIEISVIVSPLSGMPCYASGDLIRLRIQIVMNYSSVIGLPLLYATPLFLLFSLQFGISFFFFH